MTEQQEALEKLEQTLTMAVEEIQRYRKTYLSVCQVCGHDLEDGSCEFCKLHPDN